MFDEVFGEVIYDYGYTANKIIDFFGENIEIEIIVNAEEEEEIQCVQHDAYNALMDNWEEIQHKVVNAILQYYNEEEKGAYGPDDEDEFNEWWPDIESEEQMSKSIHLETIVVPEDFIMEIKGENAIYLLFSRDWGGEDLDENGVAVLIVDGEVSEVGYKDIAF